MRRALKAHFASLYKTLLYKAEPMRWLLQLETELKVGWLYQVLTSFIYLPLLYNETVQSALKFL